MQKLNLGCGNDVKRGWVNLDYVKAKGVDVIHNLNKTPYPFKNEEFEEIYASHVLEHVEGDWFKIISELYRILKKNGKLVVKVPHFTSAIAFIENHRRFFRYRSFESLESQDTMRALDQIKDYKFKIEKRKISFIKWPFLYNYIIEYFVNSSRAAALLYENTFLRSLFPADELTFVMKKL